MKIVKKLVLISSLILLSGCQYFTSSDEPQTIQLATDSPVAYYYVQELTKNENFSITYISTEDLASEESLSGFHYFLATQSDALDLSEMTDFNSSIINLSTDMETSFMTYEDNELYKVNLYPSESEKDIILNYLIQNGIAFSEEDQEKYMPIINTLSNNEYFGEDTQPELTKFLMSISNSTGLYEFVLMDVTAGLEYWFERSVFDDSFVLKKVTDHAVQAQQIDAVETAPKQSDLTQSKSQQQLNAYEGVEDNTYLGEYWVTHSNHLTLVDKIYNAFNRNMNPINASGNRKSVLDRLEILETMAQERISSYESPLVIFVGEPSAVGVFDIFGERLEVASLLDSRSENKLSKNYQRLLTYLKVLPVKKIIAQKGTGDSVIKQLKIEIPDLEVYYIDGLNTITENDENLYERLQGNIENIAKSVINKQ